MKYFYLNENENTTYVKVWNATRQCKRGTCSQHEVRVLENKRQVSELIFHF